MARRRIHSESLSPPLLPDDVSGLGHFLPVVADWFRQSLGTPTDAQVQGWNAIRAGHHSLIVAPTGSGKTLAAFLAGLDHLWRTPERPKGVRILYLSPLKALSQDIRINLEKPLAGVSALAKDRGIQLPELRVALRTGDTPTAERQAQARKPSDVFITTPESLHLILGSSARAMLKTVRWVIVDELHSLAGQKRGTFLSVLLERLVEEIGAEPQRIGLTATVNPLESAARFLGGHRWIESGGKGAKGCFEPRPVSIVRSVAPKTWDLLVQRAAVDDDPDSPRSIWPRLEKDLLTLVREHRSTLIFANDRFSVERMTARINALAADSQSAEPEDANDSYTENATHSACDSKSDSDEPTDLVDDSGKATEPDDDAEIPACVQAHHGSIALDRRRRIETDLKEGRLKGVICTASLEMGIDMGAVDLVCQVGSPGEVARGLQRVGRAGHGVGQVSKGRFFAKTTPDLLETAALVHAMSRGDVEPLAIPRNCLDILAQQVIACVAVRPWKPKELLRLFRRCEPYHGLSDKAFESVLQMVAGRFRVEAVRDLKARIFWDRVRDELMPLPGTASLAMTGGGAIADTGQYPVKLGEDGPTLGTLDEEFVLERRNGEAFRLGSSTWRIDRIDPDKVVVSPSNQGELAVMPFWRGETARRSATLGRSIGQLVRAIAERTDDDAALRLLTGDCRLDLNAAQDLRRMIDRQMRLAGAAPDDRTILVEAFRDPAGEVALAVMSPWGGRLHQALKLILQSRVEERIGIRPAAQHANDGLIMRLPRDMEDQPTLDILDGLTFDEAERRLQAELADSALFGLRFRQNASRALLLPRPDPGRRTPLWLQRLRSKDLLGIVRQMPDFPIVAETSRECLSQDLDLDLLRTVLDGIVSGVFRVVKHAGEVAGPFAADLMNRFERKFLYEWDDPHPGGRSATRTADRSQGPLLDELLEPAVVERLGRKLAESVLRPARSAEELAERLSRLGDLANGEVCEENLAWLRDLESRELCRYLPVRGDHGLWIPSEEFGTYAIAFPSLGIAPGGGFRTAVADTARWQAIDAILSRFVKSRALISLAEITDRYPLEPTLAAEWLGRLTDSGGFARVRKPGEENGEMVWAETDRLRSMIGQSLVQRRHEVRAIAPDAWAAWVAEQAFAGISGQAESIGPIRELESVLLPLQGWAATPKEWLEEILPVRCSAQAIATIDDLLAAGEWTWAPMPGEDRNEAPRIVIYRRDLPPLFGSPDISLDENDETAMAIRKALSNDGPATAQRLAERTGKPLKVVKAALRGALLRGSVTNERLRFLDRFLSADRVVSGSAKSTVATAQARSGRKLNNFRALLMQQGVGLGGVTSGRRTVLAEAVPVEGRWRWIEAGAVAERTAAEDPLAFAVAILIRRYGIACRETARFGAPGVPWQELLAWMEAAEWRGDLRRGYFVEGLAGMQFTTEDIARDLALFAEAATAGSNQRSPRFRWLSAVDPANVYGASAPLDLPLIEGGKARLPRMPGNSIILADGAPVWIVQERGKRLTSLPHASEAILKQGLEHFIKIFMKSTPKWTVTTLDDAPAATTRYAEALIDLGFFRDGLSLTVYRGLI